MVVIEVMHNGIVVELAVQYGTLIYGRELFKFKNPRRKVKFLSREVCLSFFLDMVCLHVGLWENWLRTAHLFAAGSGPVYMYSMASCGTADSVDRFPGKNNQGFSKNQRESGSW